MISRGSKGVPRTEPPFFISMLSFLIPGSDAASPADDRRRDHTLHNRLIKDKQYLSGNTEGPKLPQEVQSALFLLLDGYTVASPLQSVVQVNTEVFILLHHLHFFSHDGNSV
ncbi:hypothetical protein ATANTOWER_016364 [Ataeniobius toweri]|uniref:Uncharacterized protein n=1 Tax=Ataeniobius toweri TaxID=208326 RepID=A0ABU7API5_9TELE|nr:hypothetical protein [Ataeniobius toweri]